MAEKPVCIAHMYRGVPQIHPPSCINPLHFSAKSCSGIFIPCISPLPPKKTHPKVEEDSSHLSTVKLSTVKLSTANADRPQQRSTRQLLCRSGLLPRPLLASQRCLLLVETPPHSGSRSVWWYHSARTKPASTEVLNIFHQSQACGRA